MQLTINDRASFPVTRREYTDEGFLRVPGKVARTGIQEYLASELGLTDRAPNDIVRVYRPSEEVFNNDSLDSYAGADVTVEHPSEMVSADSYNSVSVGTVRGPGRQVGDFVECDLIIKAKDGVTAAESGKVQLSAGYTAIYDDNVPEGADYDFIQRDIKINHVALVDRARAGAQARLFDNQGVKRMKTINLDSGRSVEVQDDATAVLIADAMDRLTKRATDAETNVERLQATVDGVTEERDNLKKTASDEAIAKRVAAVASTVTDARKIAGKEFTSDSVVIADIQRAALAVKRPNIAWGDKSDVYVQAAWDQAMESEEDEDDEDDKKESNDSHRRLANDAARQAQQEVNDSRQKALDATRDAWKPTAGEV